mmetsp:Transcript_29693/g.73567  ORF Transcript_29693/g.73567 Transcript_29693/m.73567 type:complete len:176 (+) Transcript_29693:386-913(+)
MCLMMHTGVARGGASIPGVTQAFNNCIRSMEVLLRDSQGALSVEDKKAAGTSELVHYLQLMEGNVATLVDSCLEHEKAHAKTSAAAAAPAAADTRFVGGAGPDHNATAKLEKALADSRAQIENLKRKQSAAGEAARQQRAAAAAAARGAGVPGTGAKGAGAGRGKGLADAGAGAG